MNINPSVDRPSTDLREKLLQSEADVKSGRVYSLEETLSAMKQIVAEAPDDHE